MITKMQRLAIRAEGTCIKKFLLAYTYIFSNVVTRDISSFAIYVAIARLAIQTNKII